MDEARSPHHCHPAGSGRLQRGSSLADAEARQCLALLQTIKELASTPVPASTAEQHRSQPAAQRSTLAAATGPLTAPNPQLPTAGDSRDCGTSTWCISPPSRMQSLALSSNAMPAHQSLTDTGPASGGHSGSSEGAVVLQPWQPLPPPPQQQQPAASVQLPPSATAAPSAGYGPARNTAIKRSQSHSAFLPYRNSPASSARQAAAVGGAHTSAANQLPAAGNSNEQQESPFASWQCQLSQNQLSQRQISQRQISQRQLSFPLASPRPAAASAATSAVSLPASLSVASPPDPQIFAVGLELLKTNMSAEELRQLESVRQFLSAFGR